MNTSEPFSSSSSVYRFEAAARYYEKLSSDFSLYHKDPLNVALHFLTTPLGLLGACSLLRNYTQSSSTTLLITFVYLFSLVAHIPSGDFIGTAFLCFAIVQCSRLFKLTFVHAALFVVLGYVLQDLAHVATGEPTFQSTYSAGGHIDTAHPAAWLQALVEHIYYLLPLVVHTALPHISFPQELRAILAGPLPSSLQQLEAFGWVIGPLIIFALGSYCIDSRNSMCFFPGTPYFYRVVRGNLMDKLSAEQQGDTAHTSRAAQTREDMQTIRNWAMEQGVAEDKSTHFWFKDLPGSAKEAFQRCAESSVLKELFGQLFGADHYCVDILWGMNEIYVTGPERREEALNSDHVFYSRHVDGPFGFVPFVSVYRCIVGLDRNLMITTHFPLAGISQNACAGDVLAFDFNREVHYITRDASKRALSDDFRVTLKLHYCIYPRVLRPLGWLMGWCNTRYNMNFRALFLMTIAPQTLYEHFLAWNVNFNTFLFDRVETLLGIRNLAYITALAVVWRATGCYEVFFALTSFVHYFRYILTYYVRKGIDFGSFKRDVLLLKSLALVQLFYHYFNPQSMPFSWDWVSVSMIVIGYSVSVMATEAIGIDRTYFAAELGLVEPKWIEAFPYGYIPHPMIVAQVFALLGFYKAAHFRADWPYVIPIHVGLYLVHMLQEHFDIHADSVAALLQRARKQKAA